MPNNVLLLNLVHGRQTCGEALSLAACLATVNEIQQQNVIGHLWRVGTRLKEQTNRLIESNKLSDYVACVGLAPWTSLRFRDSEGKDSLLLRSLFQQEVLKRGLLTHGNHMLTLSHDDAIIEETLKSYEEAFEVLADALATGSVEKRLEGPPLQPILRQV